MQIKQTAFIQSFRNKKDFIYLVFLDIIYYCILAGTIAFVGRIIFPKFMQLYKAKDIFSSLQNASLEQIHTAVLEVKTTYYQFWIYAVITIIIFFFFNTFIKSYIWHKIIQKDYNWRIFFKFSLLNFILTLFFFIVGFLIITVINGQNQVTVLLLFLYPATLYLINLTHPLLAKTNSLKQTAKGALKLGILNCYKFIIPYIIIILMLVIILNILILLQLFLPNYIYYTIYLFTFVIYATWFKFYILEIIGRN